MRKKLSAISSQWTNPPASPFVKGGQEGDLLKRGIKRDAENVIQSAISSKQSVNSNQLSAISGQPSVSYLSFPQAKRVGNPSERFRTSRKDSGPILADARTRAGMTNNGFLTYKPINNSNQLSAISGQPSVNSNQLSAISIKKEGQAGFTLVELLITMAVFTFVIAAATSLFVPLLTQFKQQSKMAETNIEGVVGLDIMRRDIEHAGYGLPWNIPSGTTYSEASTPATPPCGSVNPSTYNDAASNAPRAIVSGNNNCTNGSDYLVIKAVNVAINDTSSKWTELIYSAACNSPLSNFATNVCKRSWEPSTEDLTSSDLVIVTFPGTTSSTERLLKANSGNYTATNLSAIPSSWLPTSTTDNIRLVYGLSSGSNAPKRPFNRADFYISTSSSVPQRCASGTGVLEKATMDYSGGFTQLPLLDCVADMQVIYRLDMNDDGTIGTQSNANGSSVSSSSEGATVTTVQTTLADPSLLRQRLKEVRVYILAHEGQKDANYTFNNFTAGACATCIRVGEVFGGQNLGSDFDLSTITNYLNYPWKLYTIVVKPENLYR